MYKQVQTFAKRIAMNRISTFLALQLQKYKSNYSIRFFLNNADGIIVFTFTYIYVHSNTCANILNNAKS